MIQPAQPKATESENPPRWARDPREESRPVHMRTTEEKKRRKEDIGLIGDMVRTKKQVKDIGPQDLDHDTIVQ